MSIAEQEENAKGARFASLTARAHSLVNRFRRDQPDLLVIGTPRSGFALLVSVLNQLLGYRKFRRDHFRQKLLRFIPEASAQICQAIEDYFRGRINLAELIISDEFKLLVGGPKWLDQKNPQMAKFRKYIGIRGRGDFLATYSLPKYIMNFYNVVHSHYEPAVWLQDPYYRAYKKFSSIRNPLDILNSSVFSINALTGEYINRYIREPVPTVREELALYKLTDLNFVEGLTTPLIGYLNSFMEVKSHYTVIRWENLITEPEKTIRGISREAGVDVSIKMARAIWAEMKFKNQTTYHVHNFRKGIVGDWKNHLVNEHLEVLKDLGFDDLLRELDYPEIEYLDQRNYTPFQRKVQDHLQKGIIYQARVDSDLFGFAFNKSNFRSENFDFISLPGRNGVEIERSSIRDVDLLEGFMETVGKVLGEVRKRLEAIHAASANPNE